MEAIQQLKLQKPRKKRVFSYNGRFLVEHRLFTDNSKAATVLCIAIDPETKKEFLIKRALLPEDFPGVNVLPTEYQVLANDLIFSLQGYEGLCFQCYDEENNSYLAVELIPKTKHLQEKTKYKGLVKAIIISMIFCNQEFSQQNLIELNGEIILIDALLQKEMWIEKLLEEFKNSSNLFDFFRKSYERVCKSFGYTNPYEYFPDYESFFILYSQEEIENEVSYTLSLIERFLKKNQEKLKKLDEFERFSGISSKFIFENLKSISRIMNVFTE